MRAQFHGVFCGVAMVAWPLIMMTGIFQQVADPFLETARQCRASDISNTRSGCACAEPREWAAFFGQLDLGALNQRISEQVPNTQLVIDHQMSARGGIRCLC